jgi:TP901 family phage tail tape measure protein
MSNENVVMNLTANADFSNLVTSVNRVTASLAKMQEQIGASNRILTGQIAATNKAFSDTLRQTGQFGTHFVTLNDDVAKFGNQLDKGQLKLRDYYSAWQQHAKTSGGLVRDLATQQVQLQNAILQPLGKNAQGLMQFNVQVPKGLDVVKNKTALASQELKIMNKVMQEGANQMINWGKNTQWAGRQLTVGLTIPLAAFGAAAAKAFREADAELVRLTKVYGGVAATSQADLSKIRKEVSATATSLAKQYGASYKDTISLAADLAATGKEGNDLLKATAQATRLMVLGEVDRQQAMKTTLTLQNTFKENTNQLGESINFLNAVENQTSLTLQDLTEAIPKAGPVIKALGGNVKDLALYLTAMKEGGIGAAEGANAIKSAFASLINPTAKATNLFKSFGIDLQGMVKKNTGNTTAMILDLQSALDKLDPLSKSKAIEQLFGKFQFARMTALIDNLGKQGSQSLRVLDLLKQSTGDIAAIADRELKQVTESASGKYKRAVEGLKADLAGIGDQFLKIQTFFINVTDKIIRFVNILPGPVKTILTLLTGLTAIAGPLIMLVGVMANFIGYIIKGAFHFKALFKSGEGWRMLTPEILAAQKAGSLIEKTFYSDAKAALSLAEALSVLEGGYSSLQSKMNTGAITVQPAISTIAGSPILAGSGAGSRVVDPRNPLVGQQGTRASAHINPLRGRTQEQIAASTIFGFVPGPIPVNNALKDTPQMYANGDLPNIPGLTTSPSKHGPVSSGIVASEATKFQTLMGTMSMMSKTEVAAMKKEIQTTGTVSTEFMTAYSSLLPEITSISQKAVTSSAAIVSQVQSGEMQLSAAKEKLIQLNYEIEAAMGAATQGVAASLGRTANLTTVPGIDQPVIDPKGKSNMRQLFGKGNASWMDKLAGIFGVKTWGASYSTHTTIPKRLNSGGAVYNPSKDGNIVPGDTSINYDTVPAMLQSGGFILNQTASKNNPDLVQLAKNKYASGGSVVPALLTAGETYFPPGLASQMMPTLESANSGTKVQLKALGGIISLRRSNYGAMPAASIIEKMIASLAQNKYAERWLKEYITGPAASNGVIRGSAQSIYKLFGLTPSKKQSFNQFGHLITDKATVPGMVAKPPTALYGETIGFRGPNKALSGNGLTDGNVRLYIENLLTGGNGAITGSSSQFIGALTKSNILDKTVATEINQRIQSQYIKELFRMKRRGIPITDDNNPYFHISDAVMKQYSSQVPHLDNLWNQFNLKTSAINSHYLKDINAQRGAGSNGVQNISLSNPAGGIGINVGKLEGAKGTRIYHAPNPVWQESLLPTSRMGIITKNWPKKEQFYGMGHQYILGNQDPLHGPLQIGKSMQMQNHAGYDPYASKSVYYGDQFGRLNIMDAFLTGTQKERGMYATSQYMGGNLGVMSQMERLGNHPLGPIAAMKSLQKKFTGKLYRGIMLGKTQNAVPADIEKAIIEARTTGNLEGLLGREFIMRRSSWSQKENIAQYFSPGHGVNPQSILFEANVKNRNVLPSSQLFPNKVFQAPYGQSWNKTRFGNGSQSEQESIFGGKFKIVGMQGGKVQLETIVDAARENGGPVNSGRPYLVGEKGPELFIPKHDGGIISHYALGGMVSSGKNGYGLSPAKAMVGKNIAGLAAWILGPMLLQKMGVSSGITNGLMTAGFAGQAAYSMHSQYKAFKGAGQGAEIAGDLAKAEGAIGKLAPRFAQLAGVASKAAGPIGLVFTAIQAYSFLEEKKRHSQEVFATSFGLSAKAAKEAGIQIQNLDAQLKASSDAAGATKTKAALLFSQDSAGIKGLSLTVGQLKSLETSVKKTMPTYMEAFKKMTGKEILTGAANIKAQWVAMGMSIQDANSKIYTLVKLTHGSQAALNAITSSAFTKITDKASASEYAIKLVGQAIKNINNVGAAGAANALDTFFQIQTAKLQALQEKAAKDGKGTPYSSSYSDTMSSYTKSGYGDIKITRDIITELSKTQPILASILNATDTIGSSLSKWIIASSGSITNLSKISTLTAAQANTVAQAIVAVQDGANKALSNDKLAGAAEKRIVTTKAALDKANMASAGMTVVDQISSKKRIKYLEDEIKKINEAASARKKAMEQQQLDADTLTQIQKKQLEYQQALASGDQAAAAQAQLDIQQLSQNRQTDIAKNSIDIAAANKTGPLQQEIDKINASLTASADAQALAANSMNNLSKSLDDLTSKDLSLKSSLQKAIEDKRIFGADSKTFKEDIKVMLDDYAALTGLKKSASGVYTDAKGNVITAEGLYASLEKATLDNINVAGKTVIVTAAGEILTGKNLTGGDALGGLPAKQKDAITKNEKKPLGQQDPNIPHPTAVGKNGPITAMPKPGLKNKNLGPATGGEPKAQTIGDYIYAGNGMVVLKSDPSQVVGQWYTYTAAGRVAYAQGGLVNHYGNGGSIRGLGTSISDSIPAYLSNGEYVVKAAAVKKYGVPTFDALNSQKFNIPSVVSSSNSMYNNNSAGSVIYLTQNITAADGMDTELLSMRIVEMTKKAIHADVQVASSKVGGTKEFGSKVIR